MIRIGKLIRYIWVKNTQTEGPTKFRQTSSQPCAFHRHTQSQRLAGVLAEVSDKETEGIMLS